MTIAPRLLFSCLSMTFATAAFSADPSDAPGAPETIRVASVESVAAGEEGRKFAFKLVKTEAGACYAVVPPGGEGMLAGDSYAVVAAADIDDATRAALSKDRPTCRVVEVVARVAK